MIMFPFSFFLTKKLDKRTQIGVSDQVQVFFLKKISPKVKANNLD